MAYSDDSEDEHDEERMNRNPLTQDLWHAAADDNISRVQELLVAAGKETSVAMSTPSSTSPVQALDKHGYPPLHWAALNGSGSVIRLLLNVGADPGCRSQRGEKQTALHWAASQGQIEACHLLLNAYKPRRNLNLLDVRDKRGYSPLMHAAQRKHDVLVAYLLQRLASIQLMDKEGRTALHWSAYAGDAASLMVLLRAGADIGARDGLGRTPLHWAMSQGHLTAVRVLLSFGAPREVEDQEGLTPAEVGRRRGHMGVGLLAHPWWGKWFEMVEAHRLLPFVIFHGGMLAGGHVLCLLIAAPDALLGWLSLLSVSSGCVAALSAYFFWSAAPGFMPTYSDAYTQAIATGNPGNVCSICRVVVPPRAYHCHSCQRCVYKADVHCVWFDRCVGGGNHHFLVYYLVSLAIDVLVLILNGTMTFVVTFFGMVEQLSELDSSFAGNNIYQLVGIAPLKAILSAALVLAGSFCLFPILMLLYSHLSGAVSNVTYREMVQVYGYRYDATKNPWDKGWQSNLKAFFTPSIDDDVEHCHQSQELFK